MPNRVSENLRELKPSPGSWFSPADPEEHERGNEGHDVNDFCQNCGAGFAFHINGRCPKR